jgi:hypothetical protein
LYRRCVLPVHEPAIDLSELIPLSKLRRYQNRYKRRLDFFLDLCFMAWNDSGTPKKGSGNVSWATLGQNIRRNGTTVALMHRRPLLLLAQKNRSRFGPTRNARFWSHFVAKRIAHNVIESFFKFRPTKFFMDLGAPKKSRFSSLLLAPHSTLLAKNSGGRSPGRTGQSVNNIWEHWTVSGQPLGALDGQWTTFGSTGQSVDNIWEHWTVSGQHSEHCAVGGQLLGAQNS